MKPRLQQTLYYILQIRAVYNEGGAEQTKKPADFALQMDNV